MDLQIQTTIIIIQPNNMLSLCARILNPFPQLLTFGYGSYFFAPFILRVAVAVVLGYLAYKHFKNREKLADMRFPIVGSGMWIVWLAFVVEGLTALGLFVGSHTQYAAILGGLIALKQLVWGRKYPHFFMLSTGTAALVLVICLSLLLTGAGALAFDLPL
jgi:hypothetical protein